jgi:putative phosphotransacetylase
VSEKKAAAQQLRKGSDDYIIDVIVDEVKRALGDSSPELEKVSSYPSIPLGVSNRHIHITQETFTKLFGSDSKFESDRALYQPGEFASKHSLTIVGTKMRAIQNVRILGPMRKIDQVEISLSDAIFLGIDAPVHNSGNLEGAAPLTLIGPEGSIYLEQCAIVASRHIHMTSKHAGIFGVKNGDFCKIRVPGVKSTIFENVLVRVNDDWKLQIHLDTDDANAANVRGEMEVEFMGKM